MKVDFFNNCQDRRWKKTHSFQSSVSDIVVFITYLTVNAKAANPIITHRFVIHDWKLETGAEILDDWPSLEAFSHVLLLSSSTCKIPHLARFIKCAENSLL